MSIINIPANILEKLDFLGLEALKRYQFAVSIDNEHFGYQYLVGFERISGLGDMINVRDVQEGGHPGIHRYPRRVKRDSIQLVRVMTFNHGLWEWFEEVRSWQKGKPSYSRTLSIIMLDYISPRQTGGQPIQFEVWRFDIVDAWPSEWQASSLDANTEELAFETITLQHGGISRAKSLITGDVADVLSLVQ